jgi:hypothetical protein
MDDEILFYKRQPFLEQEYYKEAFLMMKRLLLKYECDFMVCELDEIVSEIDKIRYSSSKFLPKIGSLLRCIAFVVEDETKWRELQFLPGVNQIPIECRLVIVRNIEEAMEIFQEFELQD